MIEKYTAMCKNISSKFKGCMAPLIIIDASFLSIGPETKMQNWMKYFHNMLYRKLHFSNFNEISSKIANGYMPP